MLTIAGLKIDRELIIKFIRFCLVGAIAFFINAGFTFIFFEVIGLEITIATIISVIITQFFQFPMSKEWAFRYKYKTKIKQILVYFSSRFASMLILTITTSIGTKIFAIPWFIAQLGGVGIGMIFNFITANWYVFNEPITKKKERNE
jgi:putative flippase GtrA